MFANLMREQHRRGLSDARMGALIGVSRWAYRRRRRNGTFSPEECRTLCRAFGICFDRLFAECPEKGGRA